MSTPYTTPAIPTKDERYDRQGDTPENASLRVNLYTAPVRHPSGFMEDAVVLVEVTPTFTTHAKGWKPPQRRPMTHHRIEDWHGGGWLSLPSDMPEIEVAARVALAKTIHGPDSEENCCRIKRAKLETKSAA